MAYRPIDESRVRLIELFTQKGHIVFDPWLQEGDTMMAALSIDREFIGIGKTQAHCDQAVSYLETSLRNKKITLFDLENHDCISDHIPNKCLDLLLSEIPQFNFKNNKQDYQKHLHDVEQLIQQYGNKLKPKAYIALIVSDQRYQGRYYCHHADIISMLEKMGFTLQGLINLIQDRQALKAYGYPSTYVPNIINQFVIIARN